MKKRIVSIVLLICMCIPTMTVCADETITNLGWDPTGKYWYEDGIRLGTVDDPECIKVNGKVVGREIHDYGTNAWYWLDATSEGEKAVNKEMWIPYVYTPNEQKISEKELNYYAKDSKGMSKLVRDAVASGSGKIVRYDENGRMFKGWYTVTGDQIAYYPDQINNTYYYDEATGIMATGNIVIDGEIYHFDEKTGVMDRPVLKTEGYTFQIDTALPQEFVKQGCKCSFQIDKITFDESEDLYCDLQYQSVIEGNFSNSKMYVEVVFLDEQNKLVYTEKVKLKKKMESTRKKLNKASLPNGFYHVEIHVFDS